MWRCKSPTISVFIKTHDEGIKNLWMVLEILSVINHHKSLHVSNDHSTSRFLVLCIFQNAADMIWMNLLSSRHWGQYTSVLHGHVFTFINTGMRSCYGGTLMRVPHGTNAANDVEVLKWLLQLNASLFEPHVGKFSMDDIAAAFGTLPIYLCSTYALSEAVTEILWFCFWCRAFSYIVSCMLHACRHIFSVPEPAESARSSLVTV